MALLLYLLLCAAVIGIFALIVMSMSVWAARYRRLRQQYRSRAIPMEVLQRTDYTENLFEIELELKTGRFCSLRQYLPGQFLTLQGPPLPAGIPVERRYSLASWVEKPGSYRLCIKRERHGKMSNWLYEHAKTGAVLSVRPPEGEFHLKRHHLNLSHIVLIAAGVGITPLKSMLEWLYHHHYQGKVTLLYTARDRAELLYHQQFLTLASQWPQLSYLPYLTGHDPACSSPELFHGRITAEELFEAGGVTAHYFFCAGQQMIDSLQPSLQNLGVSATHLQHELFTVGGSGCGSYEVRVGDKAINAEGYPALLHVLEAMQVPVDTDCRSGTCGRCRVSVESGRFKHLIDVSKDVPLAENQCLACCAIPCENLVISNSGRELG